MKLRLIYQDIIVECTFDIDETVKPCSISCPICGSSNIYHLFIQTGDIIKYEEHKCPISEWVVKQELGWTTTKDILYCLCEECQYAWLIEPIEPIGDFVKVVG